MSESPDDRIYSEEHIWLLLETDEIATIGITEYAQSELGDIVYVELPEVENEYQPGGACAIVESVKVASDIFAPIGCKIIAVNEELVDSPEVLNESPYDEGWLCKIEILDKSSIDSLLNASQYDSSIEN
ncbi:MAG: glycine cleavage system protein GcvH [Gammaproteobacteria bacterium]|nr:MAG: glycine cleavage system protein GcvH [Gammaproteobacteria bacterium]